MTTVNSRREKCKKWWMQIVMMKKARSKSVSPTVYQDSVFGSCIPISLSSGPGSIDMSPIYNSSDINTLRIKQWNEPYHICKHSCTSSVSVSVLSLSSVMLVRYECTDLQSLPRLYILILSNEMLGPCQPHQVTVRPGDNIML